MHIVIIGGTGHIGSYLVPRLIMAGHEITNVSRGTQKPYHDSPAWKAVRQITIDRDKEEKTGGFGTMIAALQPDVVIDMVCFTLESAHQIVEALEGQVQHFLHCGTIWVHGPSVEVPTAEEAPSNTFGEYGLQKAAIQAYLLEMARMRGFPATVLMPGHIMGPGWEVLTPQGNRNQEVIGKIARGEEITLPNLGMETLHHVHADDLAQAFELAINHWSVAVGEAFHTVSPAALTLRGFAEAMYGWFGQTPKLRFLPWDEWRLTVSPEDAEATWDHIARSPNASIAKAQRLLGYQPRYTSLQACYEATMWQVEHGAVQV
jgi:nucleoside-diphosphate-sugar epimerase